MRTLQRNKKPLKYSNLITKQGETITDKNGNVLDVGEDETFYSTPIDFKANIVMSGNGEAEMVEYGMDLSDYDAKIVVPINTLPIKEGSLIWQNSEPQLDENDHAIKESADYIVKKISPTINVDKIILQRLVN